MLGYGLRSGEGPERGGRSSSMPAETFVFEDFVLDPERGELRRGEQLVSVRGKPLALLLCLLQQGGRVVGKDALLAQVWPDVTVSDAALTSALRDLRRALNDDASPHRLVVTVRGKGYRFAGLAQPSRHEPGAIRSAAAGERDSLANVRPFVERLNVLAQLECSLQAAGSGALRISLIAGPAGIGKTRTALELVRIARARGFEVVIAHCYGGDGATPFWPWLELVRRALPQLEHRAFDARERALLAPLASLVPELVAQRKGSERRDEDLLAERFRLFEAFATLVRAYCRVRPMLLLIDDLHWADEASLLLLEFVAVQLKDVPLHMVAAFRDGEVGWAHPLPRVLGVMAAQPSTERVDFSGLSSAAVAALLRAAAGREPSGEFVAKVHQATAGNPFFVSELARLFAAGQLDACEDGAQIPVPARVRDAVRLQVKRRSSECGALLRLASVVGRELELLPLASALGLPQPRALALLDEAEAAGLLQHMEGEPGRYGFVHDLVRETLYRDLGSAARSELHRKMAEAIAAQAGEGRLQELSYHYGEAAKGRPERSRARRWTTPSARRSARSRCSLTRTRRHTTIAR